MNFSCGDTQYSNFCGNEVRDAVSCKLNTAKIGSIIDYPFVSEKLRIIDLPEISDLLINTNRIRFCVESWSMYPTLQVDDIIRVESIAPEHLQAGEIVVYHSQGRLICHRLVKKYYEGDKLYIVTKPDTSLIEEFFFSGNVVSAELVLGRVVSIERRGRMFTPDKKVINLRESILGKINLERWNWFQRAKSIIRLIYLWLQCCRLYRWLGRHICLGKISYQVGITHTAGISCRFYNYFQVNNPATDIKRIDIKEKRKYHLIAKVRGKIVGSIHLFFRPSTCPYTGLWIYNLRVRIPYRGLGIGEQLLRLSLGIARENNVQDALLSVSKNNLPAINLFRKQGFYQISTGEPTVIIMEKQLLK